MHTCFFFTFHRSCVPWSDMSHKVTGRGALRKHSTRSGPAASFAIRHVLNPERNETTETNETSGSSRNETKKRETTGKSKQNTFSTKLGGFVSFSSGFLGRFPLRTYRTETYWWAKTEHAWIEYRLINSRTSGCIRVSKWKVRRKSTFWRTIRKY
jgi:hypothetical protein